MTITLRIEQRAPQTMTFSGCNSFPSITWGSSESQIQQFCLLTQPPSVKYASTVKKILFEKLPSTARCSSTYFTCDVGVDPNAIYAVMCRKTVLIPENDEESTHLGLRQYFYLQ